MQFFHCEAQLIYFKLTRVNNTKIGKLDFITIWIFVDFFLNFFSSYETTSGIQFQLSEVMKQFDCHPPG